MGLFVLILRCDFELSPETILANGLVGTYTSGDLVLYILISCFSSYIDWSSRKLTGVLEI